MVERSETTRTTTLSVDKEDITFWQNLEVPVGDYLEEIESNFVRFSSTIFNRLERESSQWWELLGLRQKDKKARKTEFRTSLQTGNLKFLWAYCICEFIHKMGNPQLVRTFARKLLENNIFEKHKNNEQILAYVLYQSEPHQDNNPLVDMYYEHFRQRKQLSPYIGDISEPRRIETELTREIAQSILNRYEKKKKAKRQKSKVWWFKVSSDSWCIIFRRSRIRKSPIKEVNRNHFIRTADLKIFNINRDFNSVDIYTKSEPRKLAKCLSYIAHEFGGLEVTYTKQERTYYSEKVNSFIADLLSRNSSQLNLLEIEMRNVPLPTSPTMILKSVGNTGILLDLAELRREGRLPNERDCIKLKFIYKEKKYKINLHRIGEQTGLSINQTGLSPIDRKRILTFLDSVLI